MSETKKYPKLLIYAVSAMLILAVLAVLVVNRANSSRGDLPDWGEVPDFAFIAAHTGKPWGLEQMKGKLSVVNFMFTNCKGPCPVMSPKLAELYHLYKNSDKVQIVSISVDPARDSLEALRKYGERYGVTDDRWVFLRAPIEEVADLCENGFYLAADDLPMGHPTNFILVDEKGHIRSYHDGLDDGSVRILKENIRHLARAMK